MHIAVFMEDILHMNSFTHSGCLNFLQMMWALEYDPDLFSLYEETELNMEKAEGSKGKSKLTQKYGKYERENMKIKSADAPLPISVFLVASVLKDKSSVLKHQARGLDDVVKVRLQFPYIDLQLVTLRGIAKIQSCLMSP